MENTSKSTSIEALPHALGTELMHVDTCPFLVAEVIMEAIFFERQAGYPRPSSETMAK